MHGRVAVEGMIVVDRRPIGRGLSTAWGGIWERLGSFRRLRFPARAYFWVLGLFLNLGAATFATENETQAMYRNISASGSAQSHLIFKLDLLYCEGVRGRPNIGSLLIWSKPRAF